jgi:phosphoribosyl 1,2-cyclic phosphodiesterase
VEFDTDADETGPVRLLIDAGLSARELTRRLQLVEVAPESVRAILLSHEHEDHTRGVERFSRLHEVPVVCSVKTLEAMDASPSHFAGWKPIRAGLRAEVAGVEVDPFAVPHDAADPMGFVLAAGGRRFGFATDLGHATALVVERLRGCHVLMVESNHDDRMLVDGPYPWPLKQRVSGRMGHLSNREAAALLCETVGAGCRAVVLAHLSETNNTHELARRCAAEALGGCGSDAPVIHVAAPEAPLAPVAV